MELKEPVTRELTIPEGKTILKRIGGNHVSKCMNKGFVGVFTVKESEYKGFYLLVGESGTPYSEFFLKKYGVRAKVPENGLCLRLEEDCIPDNLSKETKITWMRNREVLSTPESVVASWDGMFRFREEVPNTGENGLRKPQLGALHALSGYYATDKRIDPATVVLPTGTGKTETMISMLVYQQIPKMLVVVPSSSLRNQISRKFQVLGYLPELGVVSRNCELPHVAVIKKGLKSVEEAEQLAQSSNVIVATNSILNSSNQSAIDKLCSVCTNLVVDEAHHITARTWQAVRDRFEGKKVAQFTATPFRNDGANLGGKIIYNYTMGEAQRAGYFNNINLIPVEEYYDEVIDNAVATKAVGILKKDLNQGLDHILMARVNTKKRANTVFDIYQSLSPELNPIVVHSEFSRVEVSKRLEKLITRESRVVVCVDMLGEGYDLPNLKVAAIHDHHKSLAITLQFVGRFTRTGHKDNVGEASVVMNIADPEVEGDLKHLYSQGSDWDTVLRRLSEDRIDRVVRLQGIVDSLREQGDLHNYISLWNLQPSYSAILYETKCKSWDPMRFENVLPYFDDYAFSISDDEKLLVLLAVQKTSVKWGSYKDLQDTNYKILVAHWDEELNALFIFSNDYGAFKVEKIADAISCGQCDQVHGNVVFNIFNGIEFPLVRNLGAAQVGAISFTQYFGPNVTDGLSQIEQSQSSLSNMAALGYEDGERVIWGCSERKGKIWSPQKGGSISDWIDWVKRAWVKVSTASTNEDNITRDFLRPERSTSCYTSVPVSAQWGEQLLTTFEDKVMFFFGEKERPFYGIDIKVARAPEKDAVIIDLMAEDVSSKYMLEVSDGIEKGFQYSLVDGEEVQIQKGNGLARSFSEYMDVDPIMIYYDDGSFSYNCWLVKVPDYIGSFRKEDIDTFNWEGVDIKKESMGSEMQADSIQYAFFKSIESDHEVIINDDGSGETADLVAIKDLGDEIMLTLVHCKYSASPEPGARLKDLYEVCGQAQRSVRWKHLRMNYLYNHIKIRENLWRARSETRFVKGTIADLTSIKNKARTTPVSFSGICCAARIRKGKGKQ